MDANGREKVKNMTFKARPEGRQRRRTIGRGRGRITENVVAGVQRRGSIKNMIYGEGNGEKRSRKHIPHGYPIKSQAQAAATAKKLLSF